MLYCSTKTSTREKHLRAPNYPLWHLDKLTFTVSAIHRPETQTLTNKPLLSAKHLSSQSQLYHIYILMCVKASWVNCTVM